MGYRSDVCIKCNEKAYQKLEKVILSNDCTPDEIKRKNNGDYCIIYDWVKWYSPELEYCKNIEDTLEALDEEKEEFFGFLRKGEDNEDIEEKWNNFEYSPYLVIDVSDFEDAKRIC